MISNVGDKHCDFERARQQQKPNFAFAFSSNRQKTLSPTTTELSKASSKHTLCTSKTTLHTSWRASFSDNFARKPFSISSVERENSNTQIAVTSSLRAKLDANLGLQPPRMPSRYCTDVAPRREPRCPSRHGKFPTLKSQLPQTPPEKGLS